MVNSIKVIVATTHGVSKTFVMVNDSDTGTSVLVSLQGYSGGHVLGVILYSSSALRIFEPCTVVASKRGVIACEVNGNIKMQ